jgi:hypothetical protein
MVQSRNKQSDERVEILGWTARIGAVTAEALAAREGGTVASARARLVAAERDRQLTSQRPLAGKPALYTVTQAGMRASGLRGIDPCRISVANAPHAIACAHAAGALEGRYPGHHVVGERELRREERLAGAALASARLGTGPDGGPLLHRPDLVLWPQESLYQLPIAVEVELTIKAPRRLEEICRAWARSPRISGVLYLAPADVERALVRAIARAGASERIVVVPFDCLATEERSPDSRERTIPSDA